MPLHLHATRVNCCSASEEKKCAGDAQDSKYLRVVLPDVKDTVSADRKQPEIMYEVTENIEHSRTDGSNSEVYELGVMPGRVTDVTVRPRFLMSILDSDVVADDNRDHGGH